jgi:UDP-glucuronate decarboxylase
LIIGVLSWSDTTVVGPVNLGNPEEFTMVELATAVIELTGSRSKIVHRARPEDDPRQRLPDISKAQGVLQWQPRTSLKERLKNTIAYFDELLKVPGIRATLNEAQ